MSKSNKNETKLRGIVVAGNSRQEVEENYRSVVTGVSVQALQSKGDSFTILSNADPDISLFNPHSGNMDLVTASKDFVDRLEFLASNEDSNVTAFYSLCSEGCGSHIIADDPDLLKFCPVCASELQDLDEDKINEILANEELQEDSCTEDSIISVAGSFEKAKAAYSELLANEGSRKAFSCDDVKVISNYEKIRFSPFSAKAAKKAEDVSIDMEATASGESKDTAHYFVCASTECGKHVISSSDYPVFCPVCSSGLIEPEEYKDNKIVAVASSAKEAHQQFLNLVRQELDKIHGFGSGNSIIATNVDSSAFAYDPFSGKSISEVAIPRDCDFEVNASADSADIIEAYYKVCSSDDECGVHVISTNEHKFCPSCSSSMVEPEKKDYMSLSEDDEEDPEDYDEEMDEELEDSDGDMEDSDDESYDSESGSDEDEDEELEDSDDSDDSDEDYDDSDEDSDDEESDEDMEDSDEEMEDEEEKQTLSVSAVRFRNPRIVKKSKNKKLAKKVSASLLSIASNYGTKEVDKFEVACAGTIQNETTWIAFYEGLPVAKATSVSAAKHSEIFNKPLFGNAVLAMAREDSIESALSSFGFKEFRPSFNVEAHVENEISAQVQAKVADIENQYKTEAKDYNDRMLSALATAAQGINRNFFRNMVNPNPIKTALATSIAAAGVKNPEALIAKSFSDHSDTYHKNLISKASEIVSKSLEVQNELAEAVANANAETNTDSVVRVGTPRELPKQKTMESVSSGDGSVLSRMDSILAQLGRH